jgi:hypothetical protein
MMHMVCKTLEQLENQSVPLPRQRETGTLEFVTIFVTFGGRPGARVWLRTAHYSVS